MEHEEPAEDAASQAHPKYLLFELAAFLFNAKHLLVWVRVFLLTHKRFCFKHLFDFLLGPHSLEVIRFEFGVNRQVPPREVLAQANLQTIKKLVLHAELFLQVIYIALIVFDALELLLNQLICKKGEQQSLHECKDAHHEHVGVPGLVHVELWFCAGK